MRPSRHSRYSSRALRQGRCRSSPRSQRIRSSQGRWHFPRCSRTTTTDCSTSSSPPRRALAQPDCTNGCVGEPAHCHTPQVRFQHRPWRALRLRLHAASSHSPPPPPPPPFSGRALTRAVAGAGSGRDRSHDPPRRGIVRSRSESSGRGHTHATPRVCKARRAPPIIVYISFQIRIHKLKSPNAQVTRMWSTSPTSRGKPSRPRNDHRHNCIS